MRACACVCVCVRACVCHVRTCVGWTYAHVYVHVPFHDHDHQSLHSYSLVTFKAATEFILMTDMKYMIPATIEEDTTKDNPLAAAVAAASQGRVVQQVRWDSRAIFWFCMSTVLRPFHAFMYLLRVDNISRYVKAQKTAN